MSLAQRYKSTQGETASKERLMVLLFEAALRHMRTGAQLLEQQKVREGLAVLSKSLDIVTELMATLDKAKAPEICESLERLYVFISGRLISAVAQRSPGPAHEAARVFAPLVEGFQGAVAQLATRPVEATR